MWTNNEFMRRLVRMYMYIYIYIIYRYTWYISNRKSGTPNENLVGVCLWRNIAWDRLKQLASVNGVWVL